MFFMAEESKHEEVKKEGKVILVKKSTIIIILVLIIAATALTVGWRFLFSNSADNKIEYIASGSPVLGNATIYVIEFSDYECPYCQASEGFNDGVISQLKQRDASWEAPVPKIIEEYVNTGKVSLIFRNFPVHDILEPALAAKCAQEQGKFWEYHRVLFENYNALSQTSLKRYALDLGLDMNSFNQCLDSKKYQSEVDNDVSDGKGLGVSGTPTFFVGNNETGYEKLVGAQPFSEFKKVIDSKISV
jgi:protein-disulfide isomerase